jgi:hypothetical protein
MMNVILNEAMEEITTIIYSIWNSRNQLVFYGRIIPVEETIQRALVWLNKYCKQNWNQS